MTFFDNKNDMLERREQMEKLKRPLMEKTDQVFSELNKVLEQCTLSNDNLESVIGVGYKL